MTDDVTWPERSKSWPQYFWSLISQKPCEMYGRFKVTTYRNPILRIQWSRDRWCHMSPKGQGRDPDIFEVQYLNNRARYVVGSHWLPIRNHTFGIQWSHDRWRHVTRKVKVVTTISLKLNITKIWRKNETLSNRQNFGTCYRKSISSKM